MTKSTENTSTSIWVGNYGHYNAGYLVGEWISLPMDQDALWNTISTVCKCDHFNEEVGIFDTDFDFDGYSIDEYESIDDVNALAAAIECATEFQLEAASAYISIQSSMSALEAANVIMNADDIAYYSYTVDNCFMSNDEKLGYSLLENTDTLRKLEEMGIDGYFDFEAYGRDACLNGDADTFENGYMLYSEVSTNNWTAAEILRECGYSTNDETDSSENLAA